MSIIRTGVCLTKEELAQVMSSHQADPNVGSLLNRLAVAHGLPEEELGYGLDAATGEFMRCDKPV